VTAIDEQATRDQGVAEPAPYHKVFDAALPEQTLKVLRSVVAQTLGRRDDLEVGARDTKWWISLDEIRKAAGDQPVRQIIQTIEPSPAIQSAMAAVGKDPVAILQYCIFRRFDPHRNPVPAQWHFDANILGLKTRMINTWFPLVDVGETAPGITIIRGARRPATLWQRMIDLADDDGMIPSANKRLTLFPDADVEAEVAADPEADYVTPIVPAGGAISFDHLYLHGTQRLTPEMGARESFEFRVMSERVARETGLARKWAMVRLY